MFKILVILIFYRIFGICRSNEYGIIFTVYTSQSTQVWPENTGLSTVGCSQANKVAFIVHGFTGSTSDWQLRLKDKFLQYRGGCVIIMNWGTLSDQINYKKVVSRNWPLAATTLIYRLQYITNEGFSPENILLYGHSLGARMVVEAGIKLEHLQISQIDACDPAGPLWLVYDVLNDSKRAGKNVQCIHTSSDFGTKSRRCHQDWIMGVCGHYQLGGLPTGSTTFSHNLCNEFYISAFENDFLANNKYNCPISMDLNTLPAGYKMGYMETRKSPAIKGVIPSPTSKAYPYN